MRPCQLQRTTHARAAGGRKLPLPLRCAVVPPSTEAAAYAALPSPARAPLASIQAVTVAQNAVREYGPPVLGGLAFVGVLGLHYVVEQVRNTMVTKDELELALYSTKEGALLSKVALKEDVAALKQDVAAVKEDVAVLKQDVAVLKQDVAAVKQDVAVLKQDVAAVKQDVAAVKQDVAALKQDVKEDLARLQAVTTEIKTAIIQKDSQEAAAREAALRSQVNDLQRQLGANQGAERRFAGNRRLRASAPAAQ